MLRSCAGSEDKIYGQGTVSVSPDVRTMNMPRLTAAQRERTLGRVMAEDDPSAVAIAFGVHACLQYLSPPTEICSHWKH